MGTRTTAMRKKVQQLPVINALTLTPSNRDVRVHDDLTSFGIFMQSIGGGGGGVGGVTSTCSWATGTVPPPICFPDQNPSPPPPPNVIPQTVGGGGGWIGQPPSNLEL